MPNPADNPALSDTNGEKQRRRTVYVLPNLITSGSLFSALCSLIATSHGDYVMGCYLILLSAVLDGLDGPIARLTHTQSPFGVQYDSLCDCVAFGVAPAFLMYHKLAEINEEVALYRWTDDISVGVCGLFAVCGAIRLARFNLQINDEEKLFFTGLPIPAAAAAVVSTFLVIESFLTDSRILHWMILILMLVLAYLMVSTVPFAGPKVFLRRMRGSIRGLVTAVFAIFFTVTFREFFPIIAFAVMMSYLGLGVVKVLRQKRKAMREYSPGGDITIDDMVDEEEESGDAISPEPNKTPPPPGSSSQT
ncbi:MAG: CDP-diacylglycerol--serine O-phosphatidyltransferase [Sumerlaeia bacterium]